MSEEITTADTTRINYESMPETPAPDPFWSKLVKQENQSFSGDSLFTSMNKLLHWAANVSVLGHGGREAFAGAIVRNKLSGVITYEALASLSVNELKQLGGASFDEQMVCLPGWMAPFLDRTKPWYIISRKWAMEAPHGQVPDTDVRWGCLAWGMKTTTGTTPDGGIEKQVFVQFDPAVDKIAIDNPAS